MAAVVERLRGTLGGSQNERSQQSRRNPIEIIDVDSFDDEASTSSSSQHSRLAPRPRGRQEPRERETISLVDSDDEEVEIVSSRILSGHHVNRNQSHRQFISPPPRDYSAAPPPMPAVPRRYAGQTSLPMRRHPEYPPVIPLTDPLPFEISSSPPVAGPSNQAQRVPQRAATSSHHTPVMGLGGALISQNRAQAVQRQREADIAATTVRRARPLRRHIYNPFTVTERDDDNYIHMLLNPYMNDDFLPLGFRNLAQHNHGRAAQAAETDQYQQNYTHPSCPEPGFTFDFALPSVEDDSSQRGRLFPRTSKEEPIVLGDDDDDEEPQNTAGPSASSSAREASPDSKLNLTLVCAKCLDPLILNAAMAPEEAQYKRVWALRCGHLIDEKCLNILGQPPPEDEPVADKKGKGKAKAPAHKATYGDALPQLQSQQPPVFPILDQDIRSRLRSRRPATTTTSGGDPIIPGAFPSPSSAVISSTASLPSPAKKRKVSTRKPKIEAEYEWACPVSSCGRVHVSVRIDGIWGPEKEAPGAKVGGKAGNARVEPRGAIAVFA
ncbi:hypothetical protein BDN70DRAFT_921626 [Pholiota conissans]|uniref:Uncharacterized protein n=1 Tax=Pholiota conissans TaxID=109636 RepID=A0A9P5Z0G4_9AGAR|nr:hypothetical protein BDN70DRAFT_921626 [Pholiota conissans]